MAKWQVSAEVQQRLDRHAAERAAWLAAVTPLLDGDPRITAAWLFGSLGRGDSDELSDIDLFIIVEDEHHEAIVGDRYGYMAQLGEPLLILEAPQNWPPGGVYNMALYPGDAGPHQVDWYWVKRSLAVIPSEVVLLFDRVGLPQKTTPTHFEYAPVPERPIEEVMTQEINLFWVMLLIGAKYLARGIDGFWFRDIYAKVANFVEHPLPDCITAPMPASPLEKVAIFRQSARAMDELHPLLAARGCRTPAQFPPHAYRYLDLIAAMVDSTQ